MRPFIFLVLILVFSCRDPEEKTIVGSWELKELRYGTGAEIIDDKDDFECTLCFDKNGRYREWINGKQIDDRYLLTDHHLIVLINSKTSDSLCYAYHLDGKKLILDEVDRKGSLMCDEGCSKIFKRQKK